MIETLKRFVMRIRTGGADAAAAPAADGARAAAERLYIEGAQHMAAGRLPEAEASLSRALELRHDHAEALLLQGLVLKSLGRCEDAGDSFMLAVHFKPSLAEAHLQLGLIAWAEGRRPEAERCFRSAVAADTGHAKAHNALGVVLSKSGSFAQAEDGFRRAIAIEPGYAQALSNLGCLLATRLDRWEEGATHIEAAWRLEPSNQDVLTNWALLLQHRGRLAESLAVWSGLVEDGSDVEKARLNRGLILLIQGDFARGWDEYEARKRTESEYVPRNFAFPEWKGEPLAGRTVLVHAEQGVGDQIMFASCLPDLLRLAGHCVVECDAKLERLFRRSFSEAAIVSAGEVSAGAQWMEKVPQIDCHVAIGTLPLHFRRSAAAFPQHGGYLRADPGKVVAWRRRLDLLPGRFKVGISWRGGTLQSRRSLRSIPLREWLPIVTQGGFDWVSLQYTDCREELADLQREHGVGIHHWQEAIDDYEETAALAAAVDLIIAVDNTMAHLAGALGRPAYLLLPMSPDWRWLSQGEAVPWYPSVRAFRQARGEGWAPVIAAVATEIARNASEGIS
jgi:Flp pilus assembly protein TadD